MHRGIISLQTLILQLASFEKRLPNKGCLRAQPNATVAPAARLRRLMNARFRGDATDTTRVAHSSRNSRSDSDATTAESAANHERRYSYPDGQIDNDMRPGRRGHGKKWTPVFVIRTRPFQTLNCLVRKRGAPSMRRVDLRPPRGGNSRYLRRPHAACLRAPDE